MLKIIEKFKFGIFSIETSLEEHANYNSHIASSSILLMQNANLHFLLGIS